MNLTKTIHALVDEGMSQSEALRLDRERTEKAMTKTDTITRRVNQKDVRKIRVGKTIYPVESFVHSQEGVTVTFKMRNGKTKEEFVKVGDFNKRLWHGYPPKGTSEEE